MKFKSYLGESEINESKQDFFKDDMRTQFEGWIDYLNHTDALKTFQKLNKFQEYYTIQRFAKSNSPTKDLKKYIDYMRKMEEKPEKIELYDFLAKNNDIFNRVMNYARIDSRWGGVNDLEAMGVVFGFSPNTMFKKYGIN